MADANWADVALLLRFNNAGSGTVADEKNTGATWTLNGGATQNATGAIAGAASLDLTGNTGGMYVSSTDSTVCTGLSLGAGDFTLEIDLKGTTTPTTFFTGLIETTTWGLRLRNFGADIAWESGQITVADLLDGNRKQIAISRVSSVSYFFLNGALLGSQSDTNNYGTVTSVAIGSNGSANPWANLVDEVRVTKGVGRWTAAYTADSGEHEGGSSDVTAALTNVVGTGEVGTAGPTTDLALSNVAGTGEVGTVSASIGATVALTGVAGAGEVGNVSASSSSGYGYGGGVTSAIHDALRGPFVEALSR